MEKEKIMLNVGIIGCGRIATVRHIPECYENPQVRLAGFYNRTKEKAIQLAEQYGGKVYNTIEECINDSCVDAVIISTPNVMHASVTIRALYAGKHVICEKPMATTEEECKKMVEAAKINHRVLLVAYQERYTQTHKLARKLIEDGMIGKVLSFQATFAHAGPEKKRPAENLWFYDKSQAGLGASGDLGVHKIDTIRYLLNDEVQEVTAKVNTPDSNANGIFQNLIDNNAVYILKMQNGTIGTVTASWTCYGEEINSTILFGSEGTMYISHPLSGKVELAMKNGERKIINVEEIYRANGWADSGIVREILRLIQQNEEQTGADALKTMQAVLKATLSSL